MNLKIISLKHQLQGNLVSIIWKLFFRFCGFAAGFYCAFGEKDVFCLKFDIGKNFWSFFFVAKYTKDTFMSYLLRDL